MWVARDLDQQRLAAALARSPIVVLTGPRQAGKSSLARRAAPTIPAHWFDLEDPRDLARLADPMLGLAHLQGTVVIDEAQHLPGLFPVLRVLVDQDRRPGRFLVLGSASPTLIGMAAESLTGRVTMLELPGLRPVDVGLTGIDRLWLRGGLPPSLLADGDQLSLQWRQDYLASVVERDLGLFGVRVPSTTMRRFWTMIAHYHGQVWNGAELARALAVSQPTIRRYIDILTDALLVRQLSPWHANIAKKQVRSPKVYVRDTGLLHALLGIDDPTALLGHPKVGASWEGLVLEQLVTLLEVRDPAFWSTHAGAELDLRLEWRGRLIGVEVKRTSRPAMSRSIHVALADLGLDHLLVVHAGEVTFPLADRVTAVPAAQLLVKGAAVLDEVVG